MMITFILGMVTGAIVMMITLGAYLDYKGKGDLLD